MAAESPAPARFRVLLVDDHPMFREHLAQLLARDLGLEVCGEADNVADALRLALESKPDIAIIDITLRGASGLELVREIAARKLPTRSLVLSMHDEDLYAERALRAGARGYLSKSAASSEALKAIRAVIAGEIYASSRLTTRLLQQAAGHAPGRPALSGIETLADRELEVFQLLGQGHSTKEISRELGLADSTVETYRSRIKEKLKLRSSAELYLRAGEWRHGKA